MGTFQQRPEGGGRREGQEVILGRSVQAEDTARARALSLALVQGT